MIVQGDIYSPPFSPETFDGGYSIGVLHHTPEPERGLVALAKTIKKDGWVSCSVYPNKGLYAFPSVARFRRLHNALKPFVGYSIALTYSYFSAYLLTPLFRRLNKVYLSNFTQYLEREWLPCLTYLADARWRVLDTFDAITPSLASTHTRSEVISWMEKAGCKDFIFPEWGDTSIMGVKF